MAILRNAAAVLVGATVLFAAGCDSNNNPARGADGTTATVLDLARYTSEVADPFPVNDGAFAFDDTSERTDPIAVNR